ncbi:MAG: TatD family hydrolase [Erysipelotrichaceae bacterium]|nr:TatD family hydrolase [Erysipelotrichaceae bacterium]
MTYWIDTHSHFADEAFQDDFLSYIHRCEEANVGRVLVMCMNRTEWETMIGWKKEYDWLDLACGYHPEDLQKLTEEDWKWLEEVVSDPRCVAIGEIGLDYHWDTSYNDLQKACFIKQLQLADTVNKPVLIHARDAMQDTYDILKAQNVKKGGIMHCYGGSAEMAREFVKIGYHLAFGGPLTFKNSVKPKETVADTAMENLFIETDCPYMAPVPMRGKQNESSYVHYVGEFMAQMKNVDEETLQKIQMEQYELLFGVKL